MLTAGIDIGAKTVKIVVINEDNSLREYIIEAAGQDATTAILQAWEGLKTKRDKIKTVIATGSGRKSVLNINGYVTEVAANSKGAIKLYPDTRTIIDVGAEEGRAIKINELGKVIDFAINEKCAAGAGAFTEAMARALEIPLEEMGRISLTATGNVAMNAQCAVFAESELVSLIHSETPKPDMAKAIHYAIADRIVSMVRRIGLAEKILLIGGVARNIGFVDALNKSLAINVIIPKIPELIGAYGAALLGTENNFSKDLT